MYVVDSLPPVEWLSSLEKINFISTLLFLLFWLIRGKFQPFKWGCLHERFSSVRNTGKSVLRGPGGWHGPGFPKKLGPAVQAIQKLLRCTKSPPPPPTTTFLSEIPGSVPGCRLYGRELGKLTMLLNLIYYMTETVWLTEQAHFSNWPAARDSSSYFRGICIHSHHQVWL